MDMRVLMLTQTDVRCEAAENCKLCISEDLGMAAVSWKGEIQKLPLTQETIELIRLNEWGIFQKKQKKGTRNENNH